MKMFELQRWAEEHWNSFAEMQSDPEVMADLGGPFTRDASREKFDRYRDAWKTDGVSRWAVVDYAGAFLGYAGIMIRRDPDHPLGVHHEIGWRFRRDAWGKGLATQSARQALHHAWSVLDVPEIVSYTARDNLRSRNVMRRLGLRRDPHRDFTARYPRGDWTGLVWVAERPAAITSSR
ncbi:GNAT family N-acetyltransferase [Sphingomonas lycopersici]|uniref:GNAT family N-acetyltransferase n=1 Tax=Sphingomonas lycopersici TaxID=2951807 RepID=A0AA41ZE25_9SPHN|nr:GNAT family N-acetyltransferase [Sphingomonas lycopersici]MCW6537627.1 GNAT family N-acetyltransferase [Sphingomonas lycopersici]